MPSQSITKKNMAPPVKNKAIEATSNIEGKIAEYIVRYLTESSGGKYIDCSDSSEYQKVDVDAIIGGSKVEIKHDTWIGRTGNAVYELNTHVPSAKIKGREAELLARETVTYEDMYIDDAPDGCNIKCTADYIMIIATNETSPESRRYSLCDEPAYIINNRRLNDYVRATTFKKKQFHTTFHKEDCAWNVFVTIPIKELIRLGIARTLRAEAMNALEEIKDFTSTPHTSAEYKQYFGY